VRRSIAAIIAGLSPRLAFEYSSIIALEYPQALERDREIVRLFLNLAGYAVIPLLFKNSKEPNINRTAQISNMKMQKALRTLEHSFDTN